MIICNRSYDKKYVSHGSLPAVLDDFKNAMHTVKMMGILPENIFELKDVSHDDLENYMQWLCWRIVAQTRVLKSPTGIKGTGFFLQGFTWEVLRPAAMKLIAPFDSVSIDLDAKEQKLVKDLIKLQQDAGGVDQKIDSKYENTKICNMVWKRIKYFAMTEEENPKQIKIPLNEHEQYLL